MRLTKDNNKNKNGQKYINSTKTLIDDTTNIKYKLENPYLQEKIRKFNDDQKKKKLNEKTPKQSYGAKNFQSNANIYKPNKNIQNKHNAQIQKEADKNSIYFKNKMISMSTNNNINIGNNINIITNNHIHENNLGNDYIKENNLKNSNLVIKDDNMTGYIKMKKSSDDIYDNNIINQFSDDNIRMNKIKEAMGNEKRKFRDKNSSMKHRNNRINRINREIVMSDGDLMTDEDNIDFRRNHIYSQPYKFISPTSYYNNTYKQHKNVLSNSNLKNNYFYNQNYDNLEKDDNFYNKYYSYKNPAKSNNELLNQKRKKYNSIINYKNTKNNFNNTSDIQSKTSNSFYIHKTPMNANKNTNKNLITKKDLSNDEDTYFSQLNYLYNNRDNNNLEFKAHCHSMIEDTDLPLSPYKNYTKTNSNYIDNSAKYKSNRRSKNKIRIIKKNNNTSIQEYNLSVAGDMDDYLTDFATKNNILNSKQKFHLVDNNYKNENKSSIYYYNNFSKNIQPMTISQFNLNSKNNSKINYIRNNLNSLPNYEKYENDMINNNSANNNNQITTPNFSDIGKTPKRPIQINKKFKTYNNNINNRTNDQNENISNSNNNKSRNEDNNYLILVKKRPKNDIPVPLTGLKKKNSSSNSLNQNINKVLNNDYEICNNEKINFTNNDTEKINDNINNEYNENNEDNNHESKNNENKIKNNRNKFIFDDENDIIDYIFNKFEEERKKKNYFNRKLRFSGFVLSKRLKGRNLCDIRIEDNIDKINQQLKDEKILINNKEVEFIYKEDLNKNENNKNNSDISNELNEENKKLKLEIEKLNKKDMVKNELITKLDNEKQNYINEIEKLKNEISELTTTNSKLMEEKNSMNNVNNLNNLISIDKSKEIKNSFEIENNIQFDIIDLNQDKENEKNLTNEKVNSNINNNNKDINDLNDSINNVENDDFKINNNININNDVVNYNFENLNNIEEEYNNNLNLLHSLEISSDIPNANEMNENIINEKKNNNDQINDLENKEKNEMPISNDKNESSDVNMNNNEISDKEDLNAKINDEENKLVDDNNQNDNLKNININYENLTKDEDKKNENNV